MVIVEEWGFPPHMRRDVSINRKRKIENALKYTELPKCHQAQIMKVIA
jgi:hypothetical protein